MALAAKLAISSDRRRADRLRMRLESRARVRNGRQVDILVHDLSADGMRIETSHRLEVGDLVAIHLAALPPCAARVMWIARPYAGCVFDEPLTAEDVRTAWRSSPVLWGAFDMGRDGRVAPVREAGQAPVERVLPADEQEPRLPARTRILAILAINLLLWVPVIALLAWLS